ncbi:MAG: YIP1 family protein [Euryarchaeota archaeon]|nr:YIP1 family protein [Euryarchaeota archaeon]MDP3105410.1 YIP1 family protein [Candidatus Methanoperedens sp.]
MDIQNYFNEYLRITRSCIMTPDAFFREIKDEEKRWMKPLAYALISMGVNLIGYLLVYLFLEGYPFILVVPEAILILGFFLIFVLTQIARLVGGKGNITQTFNVICYSVSVLNFSGIFFVFLILIPQLFRETGMIALAIFVFLALLLLDSFQYLIYLLIKGISITSEINKLRALAAVIISFIIVITLIFSGLFIIDELSRTSHPYIPPSQPSYNPGIDTPVPQEYNSVSIEPVQQRYNLTAYLGYAPVIDGMINGDDLWKEGMNVQTDVKGISYTITTKHDREYLYILMHWKGPSVWNDHILLLLKQDNGVPDFNMNTGRIDMYSLKYEPAIFEDWHFVSDFTSAEHQDGSAKVSYNNNIDEMVIEWKIPLNSGDTYDISVNKYPARLGFSIINDRDGGIFPAQAHQYYPETWANLEIVDTKLR